MSTETTSVIELRSRTVKLFNLGAGRGTCFLFRDRKIREQDQGPALAGRCSGQFFRVERNIKCEWLVKFENLLRQLYWEHAVVVLVTEWMGQHTYRWNAKIDAFEAEKPTPIAKWTFEGGPRDFR